MDESIQAQKAGECESQKSRPDAYNVAPFDPEGVMQRR
jgi:hypothetical protein